MRIGQELKNQKNETNFAKERPAEVQKNEDSQLHNSKEKGSTQTNKIISNSVNTKQAKKNVIAPFKPQPYRIIIKLSGANPSAPAETVTSALRKAGIIFEVEKIERYEEKSLLDLQSMKR